MDAQLLSNERAHPLSGRGIGRAAPRPWLRPAGDFYTARAAAVAPTAGRVIGAYKSLVVDRWRKRCGVDAAATKQVWQRGYYDHIIRSERDYLAIAEYIRNNPARWAEDAYCREP